MNNTETKFFEQLMDSLGQCLTPEVAAKVASLRVSPEFQTASMILPSDAPKGN